MKRVKSREELRDILKSAENSDKRAVLLKFSAEWCEPCKIMKKEIESVKDDLKDIEIVEIDVNDAEEIAELFRVGAVPTFMLIKREEIKVKEDGSVSVTCIPLMGAISGKDLVEWIRDHLR